MSCKQKQKALNEAVARGGELSIDLREHIGACLECRVAFGEDAALFAAIDSRMRQQANAKLPIAFLPRMQVRLAEEQPKHNTWSPAWAAVTALLVLVVGSVVALTMPRNLLAPIIPSNSSPHIAALPTEGNPPAFHPLVASRTARRRTPREPSSPIHDVDFQPLVSTEERIATEQLIVQIQRGEIDGGVLVSSAREELDTPTIVVPLIGPPSEDEEPSEPAGSSTIYVPERRVDTR